jgi:hypothetical protein
MVLNKYHDIERYPLANFNDLGLREKFILHVVSGVVAGAGSDDGFVVSDMPFLHANLNWLSFLLDGGLVLPSPFSDLEIYAAKGVFSFDVENARLLSNVLVPGCKNVGASFLEIHKVSSDYFSNGIKWSDESKSLLLEIMADDVEGHAKVLLRMDCYEEFYKGVRLDVEELLMVYSPSQCHYFINKSYSTAETRLGYDFAAFAYKHKNLKRRAFNENWQVSSSESYLSESFLSGVFYSLLCGLTEAEVSCMSFSDVLKLGVGKDDTLVIDGSGGNFGLLGQNAVLAEKYLEEIDKYNAVVRFIVMGFDDYEDASNFLGVDIGVIKDVSERKINESVVGSLERIYTIMSSSLS